MVLLSDELGAFEETFLWSIGGTTEPVSLTLSGEVKGPSFSVSPSEVSFGVVAHGFRYTKDVVLHNTSEVPMRFVWRLDADPSVQQ